MIESFLSHTDGLHGIAIVEYQGEPEREDE